MSEQVRNAPYGRILRAYRKRAGMTQEDAAQQAGETRAYWVKLELGYIAEPALPDRRERIAAVFGTTHAQMMAEARRLTITGRLPDEFPLPPGDARYDDLTSKLIDLIPSLSEAQIIIMLRNAEFMLGMYDPV